MPLTIYQIHSLFLDEEIIFDGNWVEFLLSIVAEVGVMEFYDLEQLPTVRSQKLESNEPAALLWSRISDPAAALWAAGAIRLCQYTEKSAQMAAVVKALQERAELGAAPITVPVEVHERVERLVSDNPALLARITLPVLNRISGYINDVMLKDISELEQDLLIFNYLTKLVYKPKKKAPPFKVGKIPAAVNSIFSEIDPHGDLYCTPAGIKLYRSILNWIKNDIPHDEMILRAKEIISK